MKAKVKGFKAGSMDELEMLINDWLNAVSIPWAYVEIHFAMCPDPKANTGITYAALLKTKP